MKRELTLNDLLTLSDEEILNIGEYLGITWEGWNTIDHVLEARHFYLNKGYTHNSFSKMITKFNALSIIELIREYHQIDMYTVDENWCIQLFDLNVCANDQESCIYENSNEELIDLLFQCLKWLNERLRDK